MEDNGRPNNLAEEEINIGLYIVLTIVTCGLFNLYWNYRQMEACNELVGREEFGFLIWLVLSVITCGIYHFYYQYKMGSVIVEVQRKQNRAVFENLPLVSILVSCLGLFIVVDVIHQAEINKLL
jgi:hypothetical protein